MIIAMSKIVDCLMVIVKFVGYDKRSYIGVIGYGDK